MSHSSKRRASSAADTPPPKRSKKMVALVKDSSKATIDLSSENAKAFVQFYASLLAGRYPKEALNDAGITLEEVEALEREKCEADLRQSEEICWEDISANHIRDAFVDNPDWVAANYTPWLKSVRSMSDKDLKYCKKQASHYWHNERGKINAHILALVDDPLASAHLTKIDTEKNYLTSNDKGKQWLIQQCRIIMDPNCTVRNKLTPSDALTKHVMDKLIAIAGKSVAKAAKSLAQFAKRASASLIAEKHGFGAHSEKPGQNHSKKKAANKKCEISEEEPDSTSEVEVASDADFDEQPARLTLAKRK